MKPTREELLALKPGEEISHDGIRVRRVSHDPLNPTPSDVLHFRKWYLEGGLDWYANVELVEDFVGDPWDLAVWELDGSAAHGGLHYRHNGRPVEVQIGRASCRERV